MASTNARSIRSSLLAYKSTDNAPGRAGEQEKGDIFAAELHHMLDRPWVFQFEFF